jgi:hypothetical protein
MYTATKEQIADWKAEHGDIFRITVEDKACYLKKPNRKVLGFASTAGKDNPLKFNEVVLNNGWLAGDEEIKTNDDLFLSIGKKLQDMIEVKEAELEKL